MKKTIIMTITAWSFILPVSSQATPNYYVAISKETGTLVTNPIPISARSVRSPSEQDPRHQERTRLMQAASKVYEKTPPAPKLPIDEVLKRIERYRAGYADIFEDYAKYKNSDRRYSLRWGGHLPTWLLQYSRLDDISENTLYMYDKIKTNAALNIEFYKLTPEQIDVGTNRIMAAKMAILYDFLNPSETDGVYEYTELAEFVYEMWNDEAYMNKFDGIDLATILKHVVCNGFLPLHARMAAWMWFTPPYEQYRGIWRKFPAPDEVLERLMKDIVKTYPKENDMAYSYERIEKVEVGGGIKIGIRFG